MSAEQHSAARGRFATRRGEQDDADRVAAAEDRGGETSAAHGGRRGGEPAGGPSGGPAGDEDRGPLEDDLDASVTDSLGTAAPQDEVEPELGRRDGDGPAGGGWPDGELADLPDDEMDAFFPSVARAAATGQEIGAILDEELLVKALAERDEYLDALRRLQADFENFRKRTDRQLADVRARASESLLERLLPVLDALDLALAHLGDDPGAGEDGAAKSAARSAGEALSALAQVGALLRDTLAKEGLERIDTVGVAFDPTVHDAVAHAAAEDGDGGAVVDEVLRAGYQLKGRVVRPAMVKVRG